MPRHHRSRRLALALGAALTAVTTAPAAHAAGWTEGVPVSPPARVALTPKVVRTPDRARVVAWIQENAAGDRREAVGVATAPPGGQVTPAQTFPSDADDLELATGADGTVAVAWTEFGALHVARRAAGEGAFTQATPLPLPRESFDRLRVAVDHGDVYLASVGRSFEPATTRTTSTVRAARLAAGAGALVALTGTAAGTVDQVSSTDAQPRHTLSSADVAVDAGGVHIVWEDLQDAAANAAPSTTVKQATSRDGLTVGAPSPVETDPVTGTHAEDLSPALTSGGGHTYLTWTHFDPAFAAALTYQDLADPASRRAFTPKSFFPSRVVADATGALTAVWQQFDAENGVNAAVFTQTAASGAQPGVISQLSPAGAARALEDVAVGPDDGVLALLARPRDFGRTDVQVFATVRPPGGAFGQLEDVSGPRDHSDDFGQDEASAALGAGGDATAVFAADDHSGTTNARIFVTERDAAPPALTDVLVPAAAVAGSEVAMSAGAADALTGAALRWDFGDGSHATGAAVAHRYVPGTYTVTVTAADGAGNAAAQTRRLTVTAPAGAGSGNGSGPRADTTRPVLSRVSVSNPRFRVAAAASALIARAAARAPRGTAFRLTLSERATVVVTITGARGHDAPITLVRAAQPAGRRSIPFSGRAGRVALRPGRYRAALSAVDAAGNRSAATSIRFTVLPR